MEGLMSVGADRLVGALKGAYQDYESGRNLRLGNYKGHQGAKKMGHYNSSGKKLGIYHG